MYSCIICAITKQLDGAGGEMGTWISMYYLLIHLVNLKLQQKK